jgi:membrane protein implicated in regulation of membrane protease activity
MFNVGDDVIVKDNAFEGSDEPEDFEYRGKRGVIAWDLGSGEYQVDFPDGDWTYLKASELEKA